MMLQIKFGCNRPAGLGDIHVWKCGRTHGRTHARTPARVPSYKLTLWAFDSGELISAMGNQTWDFRFKENIITRSRVPPSRSSINLEIICRTFCDVNIAECGPLSSKPGKWQREHANFACFVCLLVLRVYGPVNYLGQACHCVEGLRPSQLCRSIQSVLTYSHTSWASFLSSQPVLSASTFTSN